MSKVNITDVIAYDPKAPFKTPLKFEIFFEVHQPLGHKLTWRIVYMVKASDSSEDQILEEVEMDIDQAGKMKFTFEGKHIETSLISDIVSVAGVLVTCSYNNQEFFRVGYYCNNYYDDPELAENPPEKADILKLTRHMLVEKPRVKKFTIQWEELQMLAPQMNSNFEMMPTEADINILNKMQQQQQIEKDCLPSGTQIEDRNEMMSTTNL
jgi:histone chaperone ASF1